MRDGPTVHFLHSSYIANLILTELIYNDFLYSKYSIIEIILLYSFLLEKKKLIFLCLSFTLHAVCFRSVVVITFASHAKGPQFEPGRKHIL